MKNLLPFLFALFIFLPLYPQSMIVINDQAQLLNNNTEKLLTEKLEARNLEYTKVVDFSDRCNYYFGTLRQIDNDIILQLKDCNDMLFGKKSLGRSLISATEEEKAILISFALFDLTEQLPTEIIDDEEEFQDEKPEKLPAEDILPLENEHTSRYFFAPSAFSLREGELYYNTVYFFLHDIQYGISDNFSVGMGTTIIGIPFYITPKISIPLSEKSTFAIGDMMILGTWGSKFFGNLFYGMYTQGDEQNNISIGAGWFSTNDNDITRSDNSIVFNLSALVRTSTFVYLVTENYGFQLNTRQTAWYDNYNETTMEYTYFEEDYVQKQTIWYGLTGLRFVNKSNDFVSWQFGLSHILNFFEDVPSKYKNEPWYSSATEGGSRFIAIPTISYTRKFGKKY